MHDFKYVAKKDAKPIKKELYQLLHEVQNLVRDYFTFKFTTVGSSSRNMITYDANSNIGFDFDINIKYSLQGTTQGRYLTGGVPLVRFSM